MLFLQICVLIRKDDNVFKHYLIFLFFQVSVNEAAAQLCLRKPILLMRRDELFPLARQVVRDSGYQYSKGHSRSQFQAGYPSKVFGLNNSKSGDEENSRESTNGSGGDQHHGKKRGRFSESDEGNPVKKVGQLLNIPDLKIHQMFCF